MKLTKYILPTIIALSALSVSISAAFYSVSGLSKLFAGASTEVIIMAGALEISKLVMATLLHQYWNDLNKFLKAYLSTAVVILIIITSMGIYGFLSSAYQETANKANIIDTRIEFLQQKVDFFQEDVSRYDIELERISTNIAQLSQARSTEIQVRDTTSATGFRNTVSTADVRLAQQRIQIEETNRADIQAKRSQAADSLQKYQVLVLEENIGNDLAAELGPLKYLSQLTGLSMDRIVNILLLTIIFVFDPLAVSLVVAANFAFDKVRLELRPKKEERQFPATKSFNSVPGIYDEEKEPLTEEIVENKVEVQEPVDENVVEEKKEDVNEREEETFNKEYTGKEVKVGKIIQKTPSHVHAIMEDGTRRKIKKKDVEIDKNKIRYL